MGLKRKPALRYVLNVWSLLGAKLLAPKSLQDKIPEPHARRLCTLLPHH